MALTFSIEPVKKCEIMQRRSVLITLSGVSPDIFLLKKIQGNFLQTKELMDRLFWLGNILEQILTLAHLLKYKLNILNQVSRVNLLL